MQVNLPSQRYRVEFLTQTETYSMVSGPLLRLQLHQEMV